MTKASPGALVLEPSALAMTSKRPPTTGIPGAQARRRCGSFADDADHLVWADQIGSMLAVSPMP